MKNNLVEIEGENGAKVTILVNSSEGNDSDWLSCNVRIVVKGFDCSYRCSFQKVDFERFHTCLSNSLKSLGGSAVFDTCEESLFLRISFTKLGRAGVGGKGVDIDNFSNQIIFYFESDQSYLQKTIVQLKKVLDLP
jgi:hypothetical protein